MPSASNDMSDTLLEMRQVAKSFPSGMGEITVLRDVSLVVQAGVSLSIRGESGCGKTTLLNILSALESADRGQVFWQNREIRCPIGAEGNHGFWKSLLFATKRLTTTRDPVTYHRARFLGLVFQAYYLVPELNALENVLLAARFLGAVGSSEVARGRLLLKAVGLGERLLAMPATLSGGERQRVAIARALMNKPALILADEPTGNLDEKTSRQVMDMFLSLCRNEGASLVLVTHNPEYARATDQQYWLHEGTLEKR